MFPQTFKGNSELLLPELRSRGLFWDDYALLWRTYKEYLYRRTTQKLPLKEHIASKYDWGVEDTS